MHREGQILLQKQTPAEANFIFPLSPWQKVFELFGAGPVVYWARQKDGKHLGSPTYDYLTKGARERARKSQKVIA